MPVVRPSHQRKSSSRAVILLICLIVSLFPAASPDSDIAFAEEPPAPNLIGDSTPYQYISAGSEHSCGIKPDNTIECWGDNYYGQLNVPDPNSGFSQVGAGSYHTCGLKNDGSIICWGRDTNNEASVPAPNADFVQVSAGFFYTCGLKTDGSSICWGLNDYGQASLPSPNSDFVQISAGGDHSCGLLSDMSMQCWGRDTWGQSSVPAPNADFRQVTSGYRHTCGLKNDGTLSCWGSSTYGETSVPLPNSNYASVSAGLYHTCARKSDNTAICWGWNMYGQSTVPAPNSNFSQLSAGSYHTCGLKTDGSFTCWGEDNDGQSNPNLYVQVSAGKNNTCLINKAGTIKCFGGNLGINLDVPLPNNNFIRVSVGYDHACGLKADGEIICWGGNPFIDTRTVPLPNADYQSISSGTNFSCAVKTDNTADCWPNLYVYLPPVPIASYREVSAGQEITCGVTTGNLMNCWGLAAPSPNTNYNSVSAGTSFACGTKFGGVLDCWGDNTSGQATPPSPSGNYGLVSTGEAHACGLLIVNPYSVACWGDNSFGQSTVPLPNQSFMTMDAGFHHTCAVRWDLSVICWGDNTYSKATVPQLNALKLPPSNRTPLAFDDDYAGFEDTPLVAATVDGVLSNDYDPDNPTLTAAKIGDPTQGGVALASDGSFTYTPNADYCGTDTFSYQASDGSSSSRTADVNTDITCVNDQPNFSASDPTSVNEDAGLQTIPSWSSFDPGPNESGQNVQAYSISNISIPGLFSQAPAVDQAGTLTYQSAANSNGSSTFDVQVQDNGGIANGGDDTSATQTFTVTVNPINDQPGFSASDPPSVNEDPGLQTINNWASFNPGQPDESGQGVQAYVVSSISIPGLFSQTPAVDQAGTLTYQPAPNQNGNSTFSVQVQDDGGTSNGGVDISATQTFTVTVNPVNDEPDFSASDPPSVNEDAGLQTIPNWSSFDPGPNEGSQNVQAYSVSNISNPGLFSQSPAVSLTGTMTYQSAANSYGSSTFDVQVQDNGGIANGGDDTGPAHTFTIQVSPDNDPPTSPGLGNLNIVEDTPGYIIDIWPDFDDLEDSDSQLSFSLQGYTNPSLFTLVDIDQDRYLRMAYTPDEFGTSVITVRATDTGGLFVDGDLNLELRPVNDSPTFTSGGDITVPMNSGAYSAAWASAISPGPANESGQTLNFSVNNDNNGLFSAQPSLTAAGVLDFAPTAGFTGSAQVSVTLSDDGGTTDGGVDTSPTEIFTITVAPFPTVTLIQPENGPGISPGSTVIDRVNDLRIHFDQILDNPPGNTDPDDVTNPANYLLVEAGANAILETVSCLGGVGGDDINITIYWINYPTGGNAARVFLNAGDPLPSGDYRMLVCGSTSITSNGIALAGDGTNSGTDFSLDFTLILADLLPETGFPPGVISIPAGVELDRKANSMLTLEITRLGLSLPISSIPFQDNHWDVSWLSQQAGWLEGTAFPTWAGNSVITAHNVNRSGLPGPFADLGSLVFGDQVLIRAWGQTYVYQVQTVSTQRATDLSNTLGHKDYPWLTLVTCSGYLPFLETYSSRIVVKAILVEIR